MYLNKIKIKRIQIIRDKKDKLIQLAEKRFVRQWLQIKLTLSPKSFFSVSVLYFLRQILTLHNWSSRDWTDQISKRIKKDRRRRKQLPLIWRKSLLPFYNLSDNRHIHLGFVEQKHTQGAHSETDDSDVRHETFHSEKENNSQSQHHPVRWVQTNHHLGHKRFTLWPACNHTFAWADFGPPEIILFSLGRTMIGLGVYDRETRVWSLSCNNFI